MNTYIKVKMPKPELYVIYTGSEQTKEHGMTKQAVTETIRICKDRNILKQYLSSKEVEVVTIMMSLFDNEQIMKTYAKDMARERQKEMQSQC